MMNTNAKKPQPDAHDTVKSVEGFVQWVRKDVRGQSLLYRGLADSAWQVEAAASRRVRMTEKQEQMKPSTEAMKHYIMVQLLGKARLHGLDENNGRRMSDLKLLAQLQHYGAATCMIDFTRDPLVALWFACHGEFDKDGKVVVMDTALTDAITDVEELEQGIKHFLDERDLRTWPPIPRNNRVVAQHSVFVFGEAVIEKRYCKEVHVSMAAKKEILTVLREKFEMTEESLFGDFAGFALANAQDKPCYEEYSADAYYEIAREYWRQREFEQAKYCCDKAIKQDRGHVRAYHLRGKYYERIQKIEHAIEDYNQAIDIYSEHGQIRQHVQTLITRGMACESSEIESNLENAIADYTKAIKIARSEEGNRHRLRPLLLQAYYRRGRVKATSGQHERAIEDFTSAIDVFPDTAVVDHRGPRIYRVWGSNRIYTSNIARAYLARATSHRALGNDEAAEDDEKKAFELDPKLQMTKNTFVYELVNGGSVVYIGTTKDAARRESEHRAKGWGFDALKVKTAPMAEDDAMAEEKKRLTEHKRIHGQLPQYNQMI